MLQRAKQRREEVAQQRKAEAEMKLKMQVQKQEVPATNPLTREPYTLLDAENEAGQGESSCQLAELTDGHCRAHDRE